MFSQGQQEVSGNLYVFYYFLAICHSSVYKAIFYKKTLR